MIAGGRLPAARVADSACTARSVLPASSCFSAATMARCAAAGS